MVTTSPSLYSPSNDAIFLEPFEDGLTPLIREIKAGSVENVVALIESGTSIVEAGGFSFARVPLFYVAAGDHVEIVRMLIRHSAYMGYFESPLKEAVRRGHWDLVKLLVEGGANFHLDMTRLFECTWIGRSRELNAVLAEGVDPNLRNMSGETALFCATEEGHLAVMKALLEYGADINENNTYW
uniref:Uncharacterized protein n=1 Tax=Globisporangium ultimum (strain ATCC 200006 / CBS 805.95 / DAOM BR144) TaxID=431595 RepID=K3WLR1_GLOUD